MTSHLRPVSLTAPTNTPLHVRGGLRAGRVPTCSVTIPHAGLGVVTAVRASSARLLWDWTTPVPAAFLLVRTWVPWTDPHRQQFSAGSGAGQQLEARSKENGSQGPGGTGAGAQRVPRRFAQGMRLVTSLRRALPVSVSAVGEHWGGDERCQGACPVRGPVLLGSTVPVDTLWLTRCVGDVTGPDGTVSSGTWGESRALTSCMPLPRDMPFARQRRSGDKLAETHSVSRGLCSDWDESRPLTVPRAKLLGSRCALTSRRCCEP